MTSLWDALYSQPWPASPHSLLQFLGHPETKHLFTIPRTTRIHKPSWLPERRVLYFILHIWQAAVPCTPLPPSSPSPYKHDGGSERCHLQCKRIAYLSYHSTGCNPQEFTPPQLRFLGGLGPRPALPITTPAKTGKGRKTFNDLLINRVSAQI